MGFGLLKLRSASTCSTFRPAEIPTPEAAPVDTLAGAISIRPGKWSRATNPAFRQVLGDNGETLTDVDRACIESSFAQT